MSAKRNLLLCLAACLLACFAGCGDGGSSSTVTTGDREEEAMVPPVRQAPTNPVPRPKRQAPPQDAGPPRGRVSPQSAKFRRYDGNHSLHLSSFGEEAGGSKRAQAEAVLDSYLSALEQRRWGVACGLLARSVRLQIIEIAGKQGCEPALDAYVRGLLQGEGAFPHLGSIASLRLRDEEDGREAAGFALFHGDDGDDYWMALEVDGGRWVVLSATPQRFGGSGAPAG